MLDLFLYVLLGALFLGLCLLFVFGIIIGVITVINEEKTNRIKRKINCYSYAKELGLSEKDIDFLGVRK